LFDEEIFEWLERRQAKRKKIPGQSGDELHLLQAFTCDGASHLSSMADILLGSFRYCVNEPERDIAGKAMLPALVPLMWTGTSEGKQYVRERGLNLRPKKVNTPAHQEEYDKLMDRLQGYLNGNGS
jgi:hypothetical protein